MPSDISSEEYETHKRNGPGYCVCLYILHLSVFLQYKLKAIRTHNKKKLKEKQEIESHPGVAKTALPSRQHAAV